MSKPADSVAHDELLDELSSYSLRLMWRMRQQAVRAFEPLGFRTTRVLALEFVAHGYTQPKDLAEVLGIVPPALSTIVAELEGRGLLLRQTDPNDGRRINLSLTPAGEQTRRQLREAWSKTREENRKQLSEQDLKTTLELYRKVLDEPLG